MNNIEEFENLGWLEASLEELQYNNDNLSFVMTDLISYIPEVTYEYVRVKIEGIKYLNLSLFPFIKGKYREEEYPLKFGEANHNNLLGFEGIIKVNPFTNTKAEYFWISADFAAESIYLERTGKKFKLKTSKNIN